MKLAGRLGLDVPPVHLLYTPEPAYVINRFDRVFDEASQEWLRLHVVDACQLLDLARTFKYQGASIQTLASLMDRCRERRKPGWASISGCCSTPWWATATVI